VVNIVEADLSTPGLRLIPIASPGGTLSPLNYIAAKDGRNLLAGINGGYFWRVDLGAKWVDDVCMWYATCVFIGLFVFLFINSKRSMFGPGLNVFVGKFF
jgi:hypothetical protein